MRYPFIQTSNSQTRGCVQRRHSPFLLPRTLRLKNGVTHTATLGLSHTGTLGLSHTDFVVQGALLERCFF